MLETSRFSGRILGICLVALPLTDQNWKRERDYVRDAMFTHSNKHCCKKMILRRFYNTYQDNFEPSL